MRSSSVKTLVVTVSMFAVISAGAVTAEARTAQPSRAAVSAPRDAESVAARAIATLRMLQKRFVGIVGNTLIGPPLPAPAPTTCTSSPSFFNASAD
jgi:hypothetical protein